MTWKNKVQILQIYIHPHAALEAYFKDINTYNKHSNEN